MKVSFSYDECKEWALHALLTMSQMVSGWRNPGTLEVALFTMTMPSMYHVGPMKVGPNSALCFQAAVTGQYLAVGSSSMWLIGKET